MALPKIRKLGFQETGLRYRLLIIETLVFLLPCFVIFFIFYTNNFQLNSSQLIIVAMTIALVLSGLIILRQIIDKLITISNSLRRGETGEKLYKELQSETDELKGITTSFNNVIGRLDETTDDLKCRVFELFAIKELTEIASKSLDIDNLLNILLEKSLAVSTAQIGSVLMVEDDKNRFRVVGSRGLIPGPEKDSYINIKGSLLDAVVSNRKPLLVNDIETDPQILRPNNPKYPSPAFLSTPIFVRDKLVAIMNLAHKENGKAFDSKDQEILSIMIGEIGFALENAKLHSIVGEHLKDLQKHTKALTSANENLQKEIAEKKQAQEALEKSAKYTENIINTMADLMIVLKPDLTISLVNPATCDLLGFAEDELLGLPIEKFFYDAMPFKKTIGEKIMEDGILKNPAMSYRNKSGKRLPVSFVGSAMYDNSKEDPAGFICIAHDMSEIEKLNRQVRHTQKMAAVGTLAAGVAHEIKNPLAIIIQGLESLRFFLSSMPESDKSNEMLDRIKGAAKRADTVVKGLLDFSRQTEIVFEKLEVASVINETILMIEHQFNKRNIKFIRRFSPDAKWIEADKNQMQQVFINLMVNSIEAMPRGGNITISTELHEADPEKKNINIIFGDTGHGIPEDKIHEVFEPFFSIKTDSMSTGLGLSISRGIIENHGGTIDIYSEVDKGTKITISLPSK
ncbi:MAG: GAF domain-containing protein [Desulfobacteraceae bacterium]|nr:GAF domain-containing protein [Desulfobacteraceae bacterium]